MAGKIDFQANESSPPENIVWICKAEVPSYLRVGEFYRSLDGDDIDETISVPADTLKESVVITNNDDLVRLLQSLRYWMVGDLPSEILLYVLSTGSAAVLRCISNYEPDFPYLTTLRTLVEDTLANRDGIFSLLDRALQLGDIRIVKLLRERGDEFSPHSLLCAARSGNLNCLKCAQDNKNGVSEEAFNLCIMKGHLDCLEYLQSITEKGNLQSTYYACTIAAEAGQLDCLKFLHEQGYSLHYTTANAAAANNDLDMLEYLHLHGYHCMFQGCARIAALKGYNECLLFMHEHGYPFNEDKCAWAAEGGHLHCLQFLREHGCPWDFRTCNVAIWQGHLDCLQYAHENGCACGYVEEILVDKEANLSAEMRAYVEQMLLEYDET